MSFRRQGDPPGCRQKDHEFLVWDARFGSGEDADFMVMSTAAIDTLPDHEFQVEQNTPRPAKIPPGLSFFAFLKHRQDFNAAAAVRIPKDPAGFLDFLARKLSGPQPL